MQTQPIFTDRKRARDLYRTYKAHAHYSEPMDAEIRRAYQLIAQGRLIIGAIAEIARAGLGEDRRPKLAIARADKRFVRLRTWGGHCEFIAEDRPWDVHRARSLNISVPIPGMTVGHPEGRAIVPIVPIHLRPKRGLANYHVLFEADWKDVPVDPLLVRRIGRGDIWLVVAAWDLTEVERAAMSARIRA